MWRSLSPSAHGTGVEEGHAHRHHACRHLKCHVNGLSCLPSFQFLMPQPAPCLIIQSVISKAQNENVATPPAPCTAQPTPLSCHVSHCPCLPLSHKGIGEGTMLGIERNVFITGLHASIIKVRKERRVCGKAQKVGMRACGKRNVCACVQAKLKGGEGSGRGDVFHHQTPLVRGEIYATNQTTPATPAV